MKAEIELQTSQSRKKMYQYFVRIFAMVLLLYYLGSFQNRLVAQTFNVDFKISVSSEVDSTVFGQSITVVLSVKNQGKGSIKIPRNFCFNYSRLFGKYGCTVICVPTLKKRINLPEIAKPKYQLDYFDDGLNEDQILYASDSYHILKPSEEIKEAIPLLISNVPDGEYQIQYILLHYLNNKKTEIFFSNRVDINLKKK